MGVPYGEGGAAPGGGPGGGVGAPAPGPVVPGVRTFAQPPQNDALSALLYPQRGQNMSPPSPQYTQVQGETSASPGSIAPWDRTRVISSGNRWRERGPGAPSSWRSTSFRSGMRAGRTRRSGATGRSD